MLIEARRSQSLGYTFIHYRETSGFIRYKSDGIGAQKFFVHVPTREDPVHVDLSLANAERWLERVYDVVERCPTWPHRRN